MIRIIERTLSKMCLRKICPFHASSNNLPNICLRAYIFMNVIARGGNEYQTEKNIKMKHSVLMCFPCPFLFNAKILIKGEMTTLRQHFLIRRFLIMLELLIDA